MGFNKINMFGYTYITVVVGVGVGQILTWTTGPKERSRTEIKRGERVEQGSQIGRYVKGVPDIGSGGLIPMTRYVRYKKDVDMEIDVDAARSAMQSSALRERPAAEDN